MNIQPHSNFKVPSSFKLPSTLMSATGPVWFGLFAFVFVGMLVR